MALAETQQLRMLERLRSPGQQPVTLDQLRAAGIDFPAVVIGELELNGYVIERVYEHGRQIAVRLLETAAPDPPASRRPSPMAPSFAVAGWLYASLMCRSTKRLRRHKRDGTKRSRVRGSVKRSNRQGLGRGCFAAR
jgi:hypothetical protein